MSQTSFSASLLRSGYKVVDQSADRPALPEDYKPQVPQPRPSTQTPTAAAAASPDSPYVPVGSYTFYSGGNDQMSNFRVYYGEPECRVICGMKIGYPGKVWTKVMGKETNNVEYWDRQEGEEIYFIDSTFPSSV